MIGINHFREYGAYEIGGVADGHGEGLVDANKGNVNVGQRTNFRLIACITAHVNAFAAEGEHISIACTRSMVRIVSGHGLDIHAQHIGCAAVGQDDGNVLESGGHAVVNGLRRNEDGIGFPNAGKRGLIKMITVRMADKNQVCFGNSRIRSSDGVVVNPKIIPSQDETGVVHGMNNHVTVGGSKVVAAEIVCARELGSAIVAERQIRSGRIGVLQRSADVGGKGYQSAPFGCVRGGLQAIGTSGGRRELQSRFLVRKTLDVGELERLGLRRINRRHQQQADAQQ